MKKKINMEGLFSVDYDSNEDTLFIYSKKGKTKESIEVSEDIIIDLDKEGDLVGVEVFDAFKFLKTLNKNVTQEMLSSLKEARLNLIKYKGYIIIEVIFAYKGMTIEEKLPAFSSSLYESPLVTSAYA